MSALDGYKLEYEEVNFNKRKKVKGKKMVTKTTKEVHRKATANINSFRLLQEVYRRNDTAIWFVIALCATAWAILA